ILFRPNRTRPHHFVARPHAHRFLQYCIDTFRVVIWSSARPENVAAIVDSIIAAPLKQRCVAIWGRDRFNLTAADFNTRVQCYKRLGTVWADPGVARSHPDFHSGARWDQSNTVLVDDSVEKGRSEPFNIVPLPEYFGDENEGSDILPQVHDYLNQLSLHSNVSAYMRSHPFMAQAAAQGPPSGFAGNQRV
ncbi:putative FCP1 homology domain-containing protein, partial [Lachnellula willkommii]